MKKLTYYLSNTIHFIVGLFALVAKPKWFSLNPKNQTIDVIFLSVFLIIGLYLHIYKRNNLKSISHKNKIIISISFLLFVIMLKYCIYSFYYERFLAIDISWFLSDDIKFLYLILGHLLFNIFTKKPEPDVSDI